MVLINYRVGLLIAFSIIAFATCVNAQKPRTDKYNFRKADSVAALYPNHSLQNLPALARKLTGSLTTEQEKFRSIYSWISQNIGNDYEFYTRNKKKREKLDDNPEALKEWNEKFRTRVFTKLLKEHKTVCTGYAYLMRELSYHAGLTAVIVDGYGRTSQSNIGGKGYANHSWNAIQIDGEWYLCDATWSSGALNLQERTFVKKFDDVYFMADPSLFVFNHFPLDSSWMLLEDKPTLDQFLNGPLVYSGVHRYHVQPKSPATFEVAASKDQMVLFRISKNNEENGNRITLQVNGSVVTPKVSIDEEGFQCIEHVFHSRGKHTVHVLCDDDYVLSYSVSVR